MSGFKRLLVKAALFKVPALNGLTVDLCARARTLATTGDDTDAGDEARVQLVLAAYELLNGARRVDRTRPTEVKP